MKNRKIFLYVSIALALLFLFSCTHCPEKLEDYERPFGVNSTVSQSPPKKINVFIDNSYSMLGYTEPGSKFNQIISSVISRIPLETEIKLFGFGHTSIELKGDLRKSLHIISDRSFYNQVETDLCIPFEQQIIGDPNSVNLIYTDMVQSTEFAEKDRVIFARLLRSYLGDNGFLSLMAVQADFSGVYYTEKAKGKMNVSDVSRPLYCLAFGNRKYAKFIEDKFENLFEHSFEFGNTKPNKLKCTSNVDEKDYPHNFIHKGDDNDLPVSEYNLGKGHIDFLRFTLEGYEDRFGKTLDYALAYKSKADSSFTAVNDANGMVTAEALQNGSNVTFDIPFSHNDPGQYIMRLTFRKTLPQWIAKYSTDDDTVLENMNKTYSLEAWMNFIMDNFEDYKHLATTQYYICINRR